jgi:hypothetical protein
MKLADTLRTFTDICIDKKFASKVESLYSAKLPDEIKRLLSIGRESMSYEDIPLLRSLSQSEVLDASADMQVDFIGKRLIPLYDVGDNDYIVFDISNQRWCRFNIVDEVAFSYSDRLSNLIYHNN